MLIPMNVHCPAKLPNTCHSTCASGVFRLGVRCWGETIGRVDKYKQRKRKSTVMLAAFGSAIFEKEHPLKAGPVLLGVNNCAGSAS